jgi:SAM-dependent methyltransferase
MVVGTPAACRPLDGEDHKLLRVPENSFDERIAKSYEAKWPELFEPAAIDPVVDFLAELAGTGAALELGVGTGRIAIPLSRRGVRVYGIDLSPQMVAELR